MVTVQEPRPVPASVLIVDDIHTNLIALKAVLSPLGIRVVQAQSGEEALARVREESFAVVLLDVQMPELDGFEVARRIRALETGSEVPIIFLTAIHRDEMQVKQGYAIGAADYITKPFDVDVLRARVKAFVDLYRQREEVRKAQVALRTRERDEAERRVSAFERITTAALDTHDLSALLHELLSIFLDGSDTADAAAIFLCDGEDRLELATSVTRDAGSPPTGPARIGEGFAGAILDTRRPLEVTDAEPGPAGKNGSARVAYGVPLLAENEVLGVAQISSSRTARFSEREKRLFQAVTERARWAITKHSERSRLRSILREAPALIAIFRGPGQLAELFNPTFQALVAGDDHLGRSATELGLGESILSALSHAYASGETVSRNELPLLADHDRKPHFVNVMAQPLSGPTGRIDSTLFFAVDVTEQVWARRQVEAHEAERALLLLREREARTESEYANRAKDEFLATLSHELRTPMNAVLGWTARAREKATPDLDKALAIVERNAQAQARLIEDMLDLSRIISGKLRLELSTFMADEPIEGAIEAIRPAAEAKGVELRTDFNELGELMADPDRVQQMVWNLLSNAIKFTPKGGLVTVRAERDGPKFVVRVKDSGQGIAQEFLPRVFDRFRQADGTTTRRHGGLGLGLAIVRQLAQAHGGTVHATSEGEGKGAEFVLELPIRSVPTFRRRPTPTRGTEAPITDTHPVLHELTGVRVLVVDDEPDARSLVSETLSEQGAKVAEADSARRALGLFDEFKPDIMVSDIGMPEMDGYALIRELRAKGERPARVPAIALTAYARSEDVEGVLSAGFDLHLAKPVDLKMLLTAVADLARNPPRGP